MGHLHGGCESSMFRMIQGHEFPEPIPLLSPIPCYNQVSDISILQPFLLNSKAVKRNIMSIIIDVFPSVTTLDYHYQT